MKAKNLLAMLYCLFFTLPLFGTTYFLKIAPDSPNCVKVYSYYWGMYSEITLKAELSGLYSFNTTMPAEKIYIYAYCNGVTVKATTINFEKCNSIVIRNGSYSTLNKMLCGTTPSQGNSNEENLRCFYCECCSSEGQSATAGGKVDDPNEKGTKASGSKGDEAKLRAFMDKYKIVDKPQTPVTPRPPAYYVPPKKPLPNKPKGARVPYPKGEKTIPNSKKSFPENYKNTTPAKDVKKTPK